MSRPTAIDLFSGAGGLALGLKKSGFDLRAAVEADKWAARTYRKNLGSHLLEVDIHKLAVADLLEFAQLAPGECDLLAGGPPCQGFSVQRRGADEDPRNDLVLEFLRCVEGVKPRIFLMENVSGLMSKRGRPFLEAVVSKARELGYVVHQAKLEAADYGVPQLRKRVILVGEMPRDGESYFQFPDPNVSEEGYKTVREAIADLPSPPPDGALHAEIANHAREARLSALNRERLQHIPPGGGREDLPEHLQLPCHINNPSHRHVDVYGRLEWDRPSGTITARFDSFTRGRFAHPVEHRSLTLREGARLQTFPDDFHFEGNREEVAKQIGNAVPPLLAEALGKALMRTLPKERPKKAKSSPRTGKLGVSDNQLSLALHD
ncbi:DNA cytosine methyltransferase [Burkholderia cepacia]|uniref:DNA cytosine methyltransferase n=1 Tax=Burkholderia cepacia TaxID=292 RepID=UPI00158D0566|nr:DNA cytosine methyltransferase [Burkholderia cepacia]